MQRLRLPHSESKMHWLPALGTQTPLLQVLPEPQLVEQVDRHWPPTHFLPPPQAASLEHCDSPRTPQVAWASL